MYRCDSVTYAPIVEASWAVVLQVFAHVCYLLLNFVSLVFVALDNTISVVSSFSETSQALDSLNHVILLSQLKNISIRRPVDDLVKSYLIDRK